MKFFGLGCLLWLLSGTANAYLWTSAVPTEVHLVEGGLVLIGNFNNAGVTCATGPKAIYLPSTDSNFNRKLSMALTAISTGKQIQVLIADPIETSCIQISAMGFVPVVYFNFWQLR